MQSDGRIVVAVALDFAGGPAFGVVRYNTNGSLDTSFNGTGIAYNVFSGDHNAGAMGVVVQSDGRIVVAGFAQPNGAGDWVVLARYNTDGSPDTTFHGTGMICLYASPLQHRRQL